MSKRKSQAPVEPDDQQPVVPPLEAEEEVEIDLADEEAKEGYHDPFDFQAKEQAIDKADVEPSAVLAAEGEEEKGSVPSEPEPRLLPTAPVEEQGNRPAQVAGNENVTLSRDPNLDDDLSEEAGTLPPLTEQEKAEYQALKAKKAGHIEWVEAIRNIHDRKLWRDEYQRWSDFCLSETGENKMWWCREFKWLKRQKLMKALCQARNIIVWRITKAEGDKLAELEDHPDEYVRALVETQVDYASRPKGSKKTKAGILKEKVRGQLAFLAARKNTPNLTWEEYADVLRLGENTYLIGGRRSLRNPGEPFQEIVTEPDQAKRREMLLAWTDKAGGLPFNDELLKVARGRDLYALVEALLARKKEWELQKLIQKRREELAALEAQKVEPGYTSPPKEQPAQKGADEPPGEEPAAAPGNDFVTPPQREEAGKVYDVSVTGSLAAYSFPDPLGGEYGEDELGAVFENIKEGLRRAADERLEFDVDSAVVIRTRRPDQDEDVIGWKVSKTTSGIELLEVAVGILEEGDDLSQDEKATLIELVGRLNNLA
jgi:hypothetical protein